MYYEKLAAAYVRGEAEKQRTSGDEICAADKLCLPDELRLKALDELSDTELTDIIRLGAAAGLKLYRFKHVDLLPRVRLVLGCLRGLEFRSLLDVGSGRGVFLWPFLEAFPDVSVTSVDLLDYRVELVDAVARGGVKNLRALRQDICAFDAPDEAFDTVTLLEVLEHIPDVQAAVSAAVRLSKRYVIVTVPSKPDNNPEHIHLLTRDALSELFTRAGCSKLSFNGVNGHLFMFAAK